MSDASDQGDDTHSVQIQLDSVTLDGILGIPEGAEGIVVFAHGSGSSRLSPRNQFVAKVLRDGGLATLLFDLLTPEEEEIDHETRHLRFDIELLAQRLADTTTWLLGQPDARRLRIGYFGSSAGAAAALIAATKRPDVVGAVVSRGGRPDLAMEALPNVQAPTLLIVGGADTPVIGMNERALERLNVEKRLEIIPGAGHLFHEPGTLEQVAQQARDWFLQYLTLNETTEGGRDEQTNDGRLSR